MKKLMAMALSLVLVFALIGCGDTAPQDPSAAAMSKEAKLLETAQAYLETVLELPAVSCSLGNQLSSYRLETGKLEKIDYEEYPVFAEGKVVAFATCTLDDTGEYLTGCGEKYAEAFWMTYAEHPHAAIALVYAQEGAYLVREGEAPVLLHKMPLMDCAPIKELESCRSSLVYSAIQAEAG